MSSSLVNALLGTGSLTMTVKPHPNAGNGLRMFMMIHANKLLEGYKNNVFNPFEGVSEYTFPETATDMVRHLSAEDYSARWFPIGIYKSLDEGLADFENKAVNCVLTLSLSQYTAAIQGLTCAYFASQGEDRMRWRTPSYYDVWTAKDRDPKRAWDEIFTGKAKERISAW